MDALRGQQRVGVGVGGSGGSGVGVNPGTGGSDVAGGEAAADGDAGLGEGVTDAVEDHCGVVVELGAADGQEQRAVVFGGVEVAGAGEAGSLAGADGDVAADGDFDDGGAVGLGAQQVDYDAVGGGEAQQGGGSGDDVGGGSEFDGHGCSPFVYGLGAPVSAGVAGDRRGGARNLEEAATGGAGFSARERQRA